MSNLCDGNPFEIQIEVDGSILRGFYLILNYPAQRELNVHYKNHLYSARLTEGADSVLLAMQCFLRLVDKYYTSMNQIDPDLPPAIRQAAFLYANEIEDDLPDDSDYFLSHVLVEAFGDQPVNSLAHRRVSWLCLNVLKCVIPAWTAVCDHPTAEQTFFQLLGHLRDGATVNNWDDLCQPPIATRNGHRISDCFSGMVESIAEGVANAAKYLRYGQPRFAGDVLWNAWSAQDEGAWCHKPVSFDKWVVLAALPIAYNCQEVSDALVSGQLEMLSDKVMKQNGGRPSGF